MAEEKLEKTFEEQAAEKAEKLILSRLEDGQLTTSIEGVSFSYDTLQELKEVRKEMAVEAAAKKVKCRYKIQYRL